MIAEYLEHALQFERMAADEKNPELKAQLERQSCPEADLIRCLPGALLPLGP